MILQSTYGCIDGMLIAKRQQKRSLFLATLLVSTNIIADYLAVTLIQDKHSALIVVGFSTTGLMIAMILLGLYFLSRELKGNNETDRSAFFHVWTGELGIVLVRSISPLFYSYLSAGVLASAGFLVSYNLGLHLAYIAAFPLAAGVQLAVIEASRQYSLGNTQEGIPSWWNHFAYLSLLPTVLSLFILICAPQWCISLFYAIEVADDHILFLKLFFTACLIGQMGHIFAIRIRALKKSQWVTRNYLVSELAIHIGSVALLVHLHLATPLNMGLAAITFSTCYLVLNAYVFCVLSVEFRKKVEYAK